MMNKTYRSYGSHKSYFAGKSGGHFNPGLRRFNKSPRVFHRDRWQDAMSQIHDVSRAAAFLQNLFDGFGDRLRRSQQFAGVEIALQREFVAGSAPGLGQIDAPVDAQDVRARLGHLFQNVAAAVDVKDRRHGQSGRAAMNALEDLPLVRQRELFVIGGGKLAGPGVEELDD